MRRERRSPRPWPPLESVTMGDRLQPCAVCATMYRPRADDRTPTCGRSCSKRYPSLFKPAPFSPVDWPTCNCGRVFLARRTRATCSELCEKRRRADLARIFAAEQKQPDARPCQHCGTAFSPDYGNKRREFCSFACCRKHGRRAYKASRRARMKGNNAVTFDPLVVLARDNWTCQLCGIPTPRTLRGTTHDNAPELDHIIPISKGGEHTPENTQCACRRCNLAKGDNLTGRLWAAA